MKKIKIALYKKSKTFFGRIIIWKQRGFAGRYQQYSHAELVFEDGRSFSSSEVDGGTRFKKIKFKKRNWDFIEIEVSDSNYNKISAFCESKDGDEYGWFQIFFSQGLNINIKKRETFFCSEICTMALQKAKLLCGVSANFVEPAELAFRLEEDGYKITN